MARFSPGDTVYGKDGRSYIVETVDGRTVYCTTSNGAETEFPVDLLFTAAEWAATGEQSNPGKREISYTRIRQSRHYAAGAAKVDASGANQLLTRINKLSPSLIDFCAFTQAAKILTENHEEDLVDQLSIIKSRAVFDDTPAPVRARVLAEMLETQPDALVSASGLGENLLRAMVDKGMTAHDQAFEDFQDRPRK